MLEIRQVHVTVGRREILGGINCSVGPSSLTALVGPNGAGKSTLLRVMTGELSPTSGEARLFGRPLGAYRPDALARLRAVLPQASLLAFPFTALEVVQLGLEARGGLTTQARRREAALMLERVDLAGFGGRRVAELSGGEQQRVHLARVLAQIGAPVDPDGNPRLLLLDEPTASLDIRHQIAVLEIARDFARAGGAVVAVLHDLNLAGAYADRLVLLADGRLAADGAPDAVLDPDVLEPVFRIPLRRHASSGTGTPLVLPQAFG